MTSQHDDLSSNSEEYHVDSGLGGTPITTIDRRKDKWRTASSKSTPFYPLRLGDSNDGFSPLKVTSKTPPVNLVSATNAPKMNASTIKQQLPLKLSSLSSR